MLDTSGTSFSLENIDKEMLEGYRRMAETARTPMPDIDPRWIAEAEKVLGDLDADFSWYDIKVKIAKALQQAFEAGERETLSPTILKKLGDAAIRAAAEVRKRKEQP